MIVVLMFLIYMFKWLKKKYNLQIICYGD
jgi:hypothetical protein